MHTFLPYYYSIKGYCKDGFTVGYLIFNMRKKTKVVSARKPANFLIENTAGV